MRVENPPTGKGSFVGLSGPLKSIGSQYCSNLHSKKSNNDKSGTVGGRLQHITLSSHEKSRLRCSFWSKFSDHLLLLLYQFTVWKARLDPRSLLLTETGSDDVVDGSVRFDGVCHCRRPLCRLYDTADCS